MPESTEKLNQSSREAFCKSLGIDSFQATQVWLSPLAVEDLNGVRYPPYKIRWSVGYQEYTAIVQAEIRKRIVGSWPFKYKVYECDTEKMEAEAVRIIMQTLTHTATDNNF